MVTPELLDYIKNTLDKGQDRLQITNSLTNIGWDENTINQAFSFIENPSINLSVVQPKKDVYSSRKNIVKIFKFVSVFVAVLILFFVVLFHKAIANYLHPPENKTEIKQNDDSQVINNQSTENQDTNPKIIDLSDKEILAALEQTNKAKDASVQNDTLEILETYERFYANHQQYPWTKFNNSPPLSDKDPVLFDSSQAGFGVCYSDPVTTPASSIGICDPTSSNQGILINQKELSTSFAGKQQFQYPGTKGESKLWVFHTIGLKDKKSYTFVCYVPKSISNRIKVSNLRCLNNTGDYPTIGLAGIASCAAVPLKSDKWSDPKLDGVSGMFMCTTF